MCDGFIRFLLINPTANCCARVFLSFRSLFALIPSFMCLTVCIYAVHAITIRESFIKYANESNVCRFIHSKVSWFSNGSDWNILSVVYWIFHHNMHTNFLMAWHKVKLRLKLCGSCEHIKFQTLLMQNLWQNEPKWMKKREIETDRFRVRDATFRINSHIDWTQPPPMCFHIASNWI